MCVELQLCVSGLDSRLAELLHWESEARELHGVLKASDRHMKQQGQDPRARVQEPQREGVSDPSKAALNAHLMIISNPFASKFVPTVFFRPLFHGVCNWRGRWSQKSRTFRF